MKKLFYFLIPILSFFAIQTVNAETYQLSTNDNYVSGKFSGFKQDSVSLDSHWMSFALNEGDYIQNLLLRYNYRFPVANARYNVSFTIASLKNEVPVAYLNGKACQPFYSNYVQSAASYFHLVSYSCVDLEGSAASFELNFKGELTGTDFFEINHQFYITRFDDSSSAINGSLNNINDSINNSNKKIDEVNGSINNSDVSGANSDLNNFTENELFKDSTGILAIIQAPINMLNSITSATCSPLTFPIPYMNFNIEIPCLSTVFSKHFSSEFLTLLKLAINGLIIYKVLCSLVMDIHSYKDPDTDRLEVLDL